MKLAKKALRRLRWKAVTWRQGFTQGSKIYYLYELLRQQEITNDYLMSLWVSQLPVHPNPLTRHGRKVFSQADEDGILEEILRRLELSQGTCVEIGVGDGTENNTLNLLARGWRGVWLDSQPLAIDPGCNPQILSHTRAFITAENVVDYVGLGLSALGQREIDVLSIDVDGNDGYLLQSLLRAGHLPSVIIIETNEVLPPPIRFAQPYQAEFVWDRASRNTGWSLQSLADLIQPFGYVCVACNPQTGVNAFFVNTRYLRKFSDVPSELSKIYVGRAAHPYKFKDKRTRVSPDFVEALLHSIVPK